MPAVRKKISVFVMRPVQWLLVPFTILTVPAFSIAFNRSTKPNPFFANRLVALKSSIKPFSITFNPPDTTINVCGTSTTLHSKTITGYSSPSWNDGSTGTSLTVTASGTYWWQEIGTNVVTNGNFSSGDSGFTSSYTDQSGNHTTSSLLSEATYAIAKNPSTRHSSFSSFGDHTSGNGNMMIVNGAATPNVTVWKENIPVTANTDYVFSVWATSAYPDAPAILQFSINGSPLGGTINLSSAVADGTWQYFTATWNSGSTSGFVPIGLVNQNTAATGNDFAIDDIVFAPVYRQNVIVNLNPIPVVTLTPGAACGVYDLTHSISGYDTSTYTYIFKDNVGNVITTTNAQAITQSGTYTVIETNNVTGCQSLPKTTTITINPIPAKPGITSL